MRRCADAHTTRTPSRANAPTRQHANAPTHTHTIATTRHLRQRAPTCRGTYMLTCQRADAPARTNAPTCSQRADASPRAHTPMPTRPMLTCQSASTPNCSSANVPTPDRANSTHAPMRPMCPHQIHPPATNTSWCSDATAQRHDAGDTTRRVSPRRNITPAHLPPRTPHCRSTCSNPTPACPLHHQVTVSCLNTVPSRSIRQSRHKKS